jgi:hypothetical protein
MSVCTTCLQPDLPADRQHDCLGIGEIQLTRQLGRGVIVEAAPQRALIGLRIIRDMAWPANIVNDSAPDLVNVADQVLYRVVGYDPEHASLIVDLVEDWRPTPTAQLSEVDVEDIKARWREAHGKPGTAHVVTEIRAADNQPVPGFVPFTPEHILRTGDPADALVVEPYRNDQHQDRWVFRCWGTDTCDGWLSLDHASQQSAERARDRHVSEEHGQEEPS